MNSKLAITVLSIMIFSSCTFTVKTEKTSNQAEMQQTDKNVSFPMETGFTDEYLIENFWKCVYNSAGDSLAYFTILPKNMRAVKLEPAWVEGTTLYNIGQYERIDDSPYLEAWVLVECHVPENIEPADWLRKWLIASGETILHEQEEISTSGSKFLDVLTSQTEDGNTSISRSTVHRRGQNYFFMKVSCSANGYEALAKTIRHISGSWEIER